MSNVPQILRSGQLYVNARRLEHYADLLAKLVRLFGCIKAHDNGPASGWQHQRGENPEHRCLTTAVRTEQSENLRRVNVKRHSIESLAFAIAVAKILDRNRRRLRGSARFGEGRGIECDSQRATSIVNDFAAVSVPRDSST